MSEKERLDTIQLLVFITGRPEIFYSKMSDEQLKNEYVQQRSIDAK